ncbi:unnamed protein product [Didymodactylos carnosus]|uniref:Uncharacterized protein n=1 Tax=Didymodactylos carnosus TaxID=1234261 RepID=A0A815PJK5_9BILA|nr:unnamed protein product [Didymodactylos carnosus]CAF4323674.1 unnamed protein product [Didymodactylos carnosus]
MCVRRLDQVLKTKVDELSKKKGDIHYSEIINQLTFEKLTLMHEIETIQREEQSLESQINNKNKEIQLEQNKINQYEQVLHKLQQENLISKHNKLLATDRLLDLITVQQELRDKQSEIQLKYDININNLKEYMKLQSKNGEAYDNIINFLNRNKKQKEIADLEDQLQRIKKI